MPPERWRSPDGLSNARALLGAFEAAFDSIAEFDALGHRVLARVQSSPKITLEREVVALGFLRRGVTLFAGFRCLVESSSVEPAKVIVRALLETMFSMQYLVHGGPIPEEPKLTEEGAAAQEQRARYFRAMALRRAIYRRQAFLDGVWVGNKTLTSDQRQGIEGETQAIREKLLHYRTENEDVGPLACDLDPPKRRYTDGRFSWFSFGVGKPLSVRQLAAALGHASTYDTMYDALSGLMHPRDVTQDLALVSDSALVLHPHNADAFPVLSRWAALCSKSIVLTFCWAFQQSSVDDLRDISTRFEPALNALGMDLPSSFI